MLKIRYLDIHIMFSSSFVNPLIFLNFIRRSCLRRHIPLRARSFPSHKSEPHQCSTFRSPHRWDHAPMDGLYSMLTVLTIFGTLPRVWEASILHSVGKTMVMLEGLDIRMGPFFRPGASVSGTQY